MVQLTGQGTRSGRLRTRNSGVEAYGWTYAGGRNCQDLGILHVKYPRETFHAAAALMSKQTERCGLLMSASLGPWLLQWYNRYMEGAVLMGEAETMKGPYSMASHSAKAGPALPAARSRDKHRASDAAVIFCKDTSTVWWWADYTELNYTESPKLKCT